MCAARRFRVARQGGGTVAGSGQREVCSVFSGAPRMQNRKSCHMAGQPSAAQRFRLRHQGSQLFVLPVGGCVFVGFGAYRKACLFSAAASRSPGWCIRWGGSISAHFAAGGL